MQAFTGELTQNPHLYGVKKEGTKPKDKLNCNAGTQASTHPLENLELGWPWEGSQAFMSPHLPVISLGKER